MEDWVRVQHVADFDAPPEIDQTHLASSEHDHFVGWPGHVVIVDLRRSLEFQTFTAAPLPRLGREDAAVLFEGATCPEESGDEGFPIFTGHGTTQIDSGLYSV